MSEVEAFGDRFRVAERVGLMPLMRFAHLADAGVDSEDMSALAAMYDLLEQCFLAEDWARFQRAATKARADGEALMGVVKEAIQVISERPTSPPSDSLDGQTTTAPKFDSAPVSSPEVRLIRTLEASGRADKAEFVRLANLSAS